jgi:hypothetical protein
MGAPGSDMQPAEQPAAENLLNAFKTIDDSGRDKHSKVLDYWLSIRGDREFPAIHELDPLAISDAGPCSVLLQLIGGGEDAEIRHLGEGLKAGDPVERIIDAPRPSILSSIAKKLSLVAISRNFLAFEDEFPAGDGTTRCWVTLLPLSSAGPWVDYVYAFATSETVEADAETVAEDVDEVPAEDAGQAETAADELELVDEAAAAEEAAPVEAAPASAAEKEVGFSERYPSPANPEGFYGAQSVKPVEASPPVPAAEKPAQASGATEGPLQAKLAAVRAKADEARMAKLRSNTALYEGLGAAYDFALDAEDCPEEYLKLVEAQGLKIQLRTPMRPVMKLAFDGMCDDPTIARLEAVLAWALKQELPRGSLAERIEAEGGIARLLGGETEAS